MNLSLHDFVRSWLGRELSSADGVDVVEVLEIPSVLREFYQTCGAISELTRSYNELRDPSAIESGDSYHIFFDENQCVVRWAFRECDKHLDDPIVFQGTALEKGYDWYSEEMVMSEWLRIMSLWQLVNGGYEFCGYAEAIPGATEVIESKYSFVGSHANDAVRFFGGSG